MAFRRGSRANRKPPFSPTTASTGQTRAVASHVPAAAPVTAIKRRSLALASSMALRAVEVILPLAVTAPSTSNSRQRTAASSDAGTSVRASPAELAAGRFGDRRDDFFGNGFQIGVGQGPLHGLKLDVDGDGFLPAANALAFKYVK